MALVPEEKTEKKKKWRIALFCLFAALFIVSAWQIASYYKRSADAADSTEELIEQAVTTPEPTEAPESTASPEPEGERAPLVIEWNTLKETIPDVIGWLYCADTVINYPVVQGKDNDYYLIYLADGTWNPNGAIFMDYRHSPDFSGFNSVIYGHNMYDGQMFGTLNNYKKQAYYDEHPVLYLMTPSGDWRLDAVSGMVVDHNNNGVFLPVTTDEGKQAFVDLVVKSSTFVPQVTDYGVEDRFAVLCTCSYETDTARYVLIAKMTELG